MLEPIAACREVMATVASGVAVLAFLDDAGVRRGMTISSLTPVSADPPSVLVCIGGRASCLPALVEGRVIAASVLAADHAQVSASFAYGAEDPFTVWPTTLSALGPPVLDQAPAYLIGRVERIVLHHGTAVVLAAVLGGEVRRPDTLVWWRSGYHRVVAAGVTG